MPSVRIVACRARVSWKRVLKWGSIGLNRDITYFPVAELRAAAAAGA
jgi:hypothetical protein